MCFSTFFAGFYISIHSLHTEGDRYDSAVYKRELISIHSLHTEGDRRLCYNIIIVKYISIHSLHTEGDRVLE